MDVARRQPPFPRSLLSERDRDLVPPFLLVALVVTANPTPSGARLRALSERVRERFPGVSYDDVVASLLQVGERMATATIVDFASAAYTLGERLPGAALSALHGDLEAVLTANTEPKACVQERRLLANLALEWGVDPIDSGVQ
jgi:hypothetical protein